MASAAIALALILVVSTSIPQQAFAPSGRRGFMCEFRPTAMTDPWMPYTTETIEQVSNAQEERGD